MSKYLDLKRSRKYKLREIVNGIFHFVKSGCQWRLLTSDFPKWQTVYYYFSTWKQNEIWEQIHGFLVEPTREIPEKKTGSQRPGLLMQSR